MRKYAVLTVAGTTAIRVPLIKRGVVDYALGADFTPVNGDVKVSIDNGAAANITNLPTAITYGNTAMWQFVLTAAELTGKQIVVTVSDSATKAVEDQAFIVETFGHTSAMYQTDWQDGVRMGLTALPAAAANAAGGLPISAAGALDMDDIGADVDAIETAVSAFFTSALTEAYAADGAPANFPELLYMIYSAVQQFAISGTTLTCYKLDGTTPAMVVQLSDATNPVSRTRTA